MKLHSVILSSFAAACMACVTNAAAGTSVTGFYSGEHMFAGNQVKQPFKVLHLPNGLTVTYGDITTLADFYEVVGKNLSEASSDEEKTARFKAAFDSFSKNVSTIKETNAILDVTHQEQSQVDAAMERGERAADIYKNMSASDNRHWNCITGGGCGSEWFLSPGRYLKLSEKDFDHFGENALKAYQIGHALAIQQAMLAHQTGDQKQLEVALAMNAFASHFLGDRFAAGHIRPPRVELYTTVTPNAVGSLLVNYMHDEEDAAGLYVYNLRGDHWQAFGDRFYFESGNSVGRSVLQDALQLSVDQVLNAYDQGVAQNEEAMAALIPEVDAKADNVSPLFYFDKVSGKVMRRVDVANPYDHHWTSDWWGWSTLLLLADKRGLPAEAQGSLAVSGYAQQAMKDGLIYDSGIIQSIQKQALR